MKRIVALVAVMLLRSLPVMADTYTWTDKSGTVNFSDDYSRVPKQYRKHVRKLGDMDVSPAPADAGKSGGGQSARPVTPKTDTPGAPGAKSDDSLYGGKKAETWRQEFRAREADYKQLDSQLTQLVELSKKPVGISMERFQGLPQEFKDTQKRYNEAIKAYNDLNDAANKAELPAEYRK
ncbi:MAG: DUF4124 domain-containing protein [Oryzomonas sp.]|uniref:DUF4124 domain-containing protein n=1 Tax=Oryzomonas sp. TaxID=2855186 RepID=UPI00283E86C6|nr:DUF4124 domain-containing protein [Oryzomonas sp.]MDR3578721.1 DUF4124 domain-containing protein [Oryzomonas sp.]